MSNILLKLVETCKQEDESVKYVLDVQPQIVTFVIKVQTNVMQNGESVVVEETVLNAKVTLEQLKNTPRFKSNTLFGFYPSRKEFLDTNVVTTTTNINDFINISELSKIHRVSGAMNVKIQSIVNIKTAALQFFIKNVNGTFEDCDIILAAPGLSKSFSLESNLQFEEHIRTFDHLTLLDNINVTKDTSYINDLYDKYTVESATHVDSVYVEEICGIVDRTKVVLTNGVGYFRVLKSSIDNQSFKAKVGFNSYPGIFDAE